MMVNKIKIDVNERDVNLEDRNLLESHIKNALEEIGFTFKGMSIWR
jgi:copper chaperone CopZ